MKILWLRHHCDISLPQVSRKSVASSEIHLITQEQLTNRVHLAMGQHMSAQLHAVGLCQGQEHLLKSDTPCKDVKHLSQALLLPASQQYCQPLTAGFLPLFWAHWRIHAHKILVPHIHSTPQGSPFSCRCRYGCFSPQAFPKPSGFLATCT